MSIARSNRAGFTLVEVSIAAVILVVAVSLALGGLVYVLRATSQSNAQNELDIQVQTAMERVKIDLRLSSLQEMFFYPEGAEPFTAMSFPLARDDDGDGAIDLDENGHIIWDRTVVYHVWSSVPNQLRRTVFDPRDDTLTDTERQAQLTAVVTNGNGEATYNGDNAETDVVFQNLFDWFITPSAARFDGYAEEVMRSINVNLGSVLIDSGAHDYTFQVVGKNPASTGYKVGLDTLFVTPSYGLREGEGQLPATGVTGPSPVAEYMAGGSWSGNYHLKFPATAQGNEFTLNMENDRWEETNFSAGGASHDRTSTEFDQALSPKDFVVNLDGFGFDWWATEQSGNSTGAMGSVDAYRGAAVRVLLKGEEMIGGDWIEHDGNRCWVMFKSGSGSGNKLGISAAYIAECTTSSVPSMDAVIGTAAPLLFSGSKSVTINEDSAIWSDLTSFPIEKEKSYLVSFLVENNAAKGNAWQWTDTYDPAGVDAYIIPAASSPTEADVASASWSSRGDVITTNAIVGVQYVYTTYPSNGVFTSQIFDTGQDAPQYGSIDWNSYVPYGANLAIKVRTGSSNDLSDAAAWTNVSSMAVPGPINPGDKRYIQFQAELNAGSWDLSTPKLKDVTIDWAGVDRVVDVGGTFTTGPDYGIFELTVDGESLKKGVNVHLEIYKDILGFRGTRRMTSALEAEVQPRNSGR